MCDGAPSSDLIVKAATKKAFTDKAFVEKVDKKPSLDSPVYFKGEQPNKDVLLARRMVAVLEQQRRLGEAAYPPTLRAAGRAQRVQGRRECPPQGRGDRPDGRRATVLAKKGKTVDHRRARRPERGHRGGSRVRLARPAEVRPEPGHQQDEEGDERDGGVHARRTGKARDPRAEATPGARGEGGRRAALAAARGRLGPRQGQAAALPDGEPQARGGPADGPGRRARLGGASARAGGPRACRGRVPSPRLHAGLPRGVRDPRPAQRLDQLREARRPAARAGRVQPRRVRRRPAERSGWTASSRSTATRACTARSPHEEREAGVREAGSLLVYASRR